MDEFLSEAGGQDSSNAARRRWLSVLAKAGLDELEAAWAGLGERLDYEWLRRPEIGMVMVRARAGGTGEQFNLGQMTVTRCALKLAGGDATPSRSEEHTYELQSLMRSSYAVFCLKKKTTTKHI